LGHIPQAQNRDRHKLGSSDCLIFEFARKVGIRMRTSRTVIHRLLDPHDTAVTLATLAKASKALGVKLLHVA
jgi:hypothetical protein